MLIKGSRRVAKPLNLGTLQAIKAAYKKLVAHLSRPLQPPNLSENMTTPPLLQHTIQTHVGMSYWGTEPRIRTYPPSTSNCHNLPSHNLTPISYPFLRSDPSHAMEIFTTSLLKRTIPIFPQTECLNQSRTRLTIPQSTYHERISTGSNVRYIAQWVSPHQPHYCVKKSKNW